MGMTADVFSGENEDVKTNETEDTEKGKPIDEIVGEAFEGLEEDAVDKALKERLGEVASGMAQLVGYADSLNNKLLHYALDDFFRSLDLLIRAAEALLEDQEFPEQTIPQDDRDVSYLVKEKGKLYLYQEWHENGEPQTSYTLAEALPAAKSGELMTLLAGMVFGNINDRRKEAIEASAVASALCDDAPPEEEIQKVS